MAAKPVRQSEVGVAKLHRLGANPMAGEILWTHRRVEVGPAPDAPGRFADTFAVFVAGLLAGGGAFLSWVLFVR